MTPVEKTKRDNEMLMEGYRLGLEDAIAAITAETFHMADEEQVEIVKIIRARFIAAIRSRSPQGAVEK